MTLASAPSSQSNSKPIALAIITLSLFVMETIVAQQEEPRDSSTTSESEPIKIDRISVTGTRIRSKGGQPVAPVEVFTGQELQERGYTTLADFSRNLNMNAGAVTQFTSNEGSASFNLRGLGADATLVLLNGRRIANRENASGSSRIDINAFPLSVIDRIEILKDGASAIYGPDAIAGVVNIILKKDFLGSEFSLQYRNTTDHDASEYLASASFGKFIGSGSVWGFISHQDINA